jgi:pimeloyl-ACP methyl ester carboxylesterase
VPTVNLSTGIVHYREQGRGVPLVLLHANPGDSRDFAAIIPTLAQHYRVLAVDWPGYGESAIPPRPEEWTALSFYTALREFLDALALPPALFIGNSVGGNAAARLAIDAPERVRGLVLVGGGGFTPHNPITRAFCRFMGGRFGLSPRTWAGLYLRRRSATVQDMLARAATLQSEPRRLALNRSVWRSFAQPEHDLRTRAAAIATPTLLLYGKQDPALPAGKDGRVAAQSIPQSRLVVMPCGHACFAEIPESTLEELLPFLARCVSASGLRAAA